jgi:ATP-dependent metalloprotease
MIPEKDTLNFTRKGMIASIDVAMGGRAAEELFAGQDEITSGYSFLLILGCSSDL